ncbi:hypothetical protein H4219_006363, partial [Mycoemilia scoparia]
QVQKYSNSFGPYCMLRRRNTPAHSVDLIEAELPENMWEIENEDPFDEQIGN